MVGIRPSVSYRDVGRLKHSDKAAARRHSGTTESGAGRPPETVRWTGTQETNRYFCHESRSLPAAYSLNTEIKTCVLCRDISMMGSALILNG
ncbi:hypothetical protein J6590_021303 [Homalodisca vitripennis]|nr:hypothetical protein J6590_021303 [Homalodisca vitripennis]